MWYSEGVPWTQGDLDWLLPKIANARNAGKRILNIEYTSDQAQINTIYANNASLNNLTYIAPLSLQIRTVSRLTMPFRKTNAWHKPFDRSSTLSRWPGLASSGSISPWGRCITAFDTIIEHGNGDPAAHMLLAANTSLSFSNMHLACEYYLPRPPPCAGAVSGTFQRRPVAHRQGDRGGRRGEAVPSRFFPDLRPGGGETVALLQPMLTLQGRIIPFLGYY